MTFSLWISLFVACFLVALTPGAGAVNTISNSLSEGWRRSVWGVVGQQFGLLAHIVIAAAGVGLVVAGSPALFNAIRYAGAAYLAYLGVRLMLVKTDAKAEGGEGEDSLVKPPETAWAMARRGFWVNLLNPKAVVFFLAFIPQFIRLDQPQLPQYLIFAGTTVLADVIVMLGVYAVAARPFRRVTRTPRGRRTLNTVFGVLFIGIAVLLLFLH